ncbi:uncharacterized protein SOCE26_002110 [Sorangium cellulosum]|uniref:Transposase n=1 Tax=Sorangium cellulosum TaxID=56 RepID=A0A2L0EHS0_SORCE|nr:uncharacterized protein SOCE26_002110 [Sorangium cellulosum]
MFGVLAFAERQIVPGKPLRARGLARLIWQMFSVEIHPRTIERALGGKKNRHSGRPSRW